MNNLKKIKGRIACNEFSIEKEQGKNSEYKVIKMAKLLTSEGIVEIDFMCTRKQLKALNLCLSNETEVTLELKKLDGNTIGHDLVRLHYDKKIIVNGESSGAHRMGLLIIGLIISIIFAIPFKPSLLLTTFFLYHIFKNVTERLQK